ncbi:hypothetical protein [Glutamicibacter creatinolyticus]|uniref:hypothetical protein n=1 Tax=Glutamicibacter creatinolyticus TaxID=162496 RepID=UPI0037BF3444
MSDMTFEPLPPDTEVSEVDLVDQRLEVDPDIEDEQIPPLHTANAPVNEADWIDQKITVQLDDPGQEVV